MVGVGNGDETANSSWLHHCMRHSQGIICECRICAKHRQTPGERPQRLRSLVAIATVTASAVHKELPLTLQRRLLQAILGLLGLAALAGVSTIFIAGGEVLFRVAGTLVLAAVAIGLSIPASQQLGVQAKRTAGLVSLLAIVIGLCLALSAMWFDFLFSQWSYDLTLTTLAYIATVAPGLAFLALTLRKGGRIAGAAGGAFCIAVFASWMAAIWGGRVGFGGHSEDWATTAGVLCAGVLPVSASLFGTLASGRHWRFLGALAGMAGVALGLSGIWLALGGKPTFVVHCFIVATVVGGTNVLDRLTLKSAQWLRLATIVMLVVTGLLGMFVNQFEVNQFDYGFDSMSLRLLTASAIVLCCALLALAVLMAFNRRLVITEARSIAAITSVTVICPRCNTKQSAPLGESNCTGCKLIFLLKLAEPHCRKCNYLLLDLKSDRCPECGEPITVAAGAPSIMA